MEKLINNPDLTGKVICGLALLVVFIIMVVFEAGYLFRVQELNLFLYTPLFFKQQLVVAGGMLTWAGTYFTQFFYHPWIGALLLCLWTALLMWLTAKTFSIKGLWMPLLLIPVALVLLTDFDLGYWLYYLKLRGHFFICVMGTSIAVALTWLYRVLPVQRHTFMAIAAVVAYPIAGFYGLLAVALMGIIAWRLPDSSLTQRLIATVFSIVLIAFVPLIYYRMVYYQANSDLIWWQALPIFNLTGTFSARYWPYILLSLFLALLAATYKSERPEPMKKTWQKVAFQIACTAGIAFGCWHFWYKDTTFHEEIEMNACVDHCDWEGVLQLVRKHEGEPTRMIVMYKNLALFKLGRAGNEMYNYPDGSKAPVCDFDIRMTQLGGKNLYLFYGLPNYCYRWCLEDGVEYGWRAEYLKFLVRCSLLNGEWQVARKYIDLLKQTRYHGEWARQYEMMATPEVNQLTAQDPNLGAIRRLMEGNDLLGSDQSLIELFLLNTQAFRVTNDVVCAELALLSALQLKDIPAFWRAFNQYALLKKDGQIARHYQEAAFLYGNLEHNVDISRMPFDPSIPATYKAFMQMAQQYQGMTEEQLKDIMRPRFGNTFFYNYFLMRNLNTY